ncbi:MAG: hypothetical protein KGL34_10495 [Gammaproteobacteria bacterium]|nr:hypothetical protein [Gammaproteobacteria bacterium]
MRLSGPVYESLPFVYAAIGAVAVAVSYLDVPGVRAAAVFLVGIAAEIAALTLYLRRRGYREMRREYSGGELAPPAGAHDRGQGAKGREA